MKYLTPKNFKCTLCGECCRPIVKVNESDIQRIEKAGYEREEFLVKDPLMDKAKEKDTLKQKNGVCMFLKRQGDKYYCDIYDHRPNACRIYPFNKEGLKLTTCIPKFRFEPEPLMNLVEEK